MHPEDRVIFVYRPKFRPYRKKQEYIFIKVTYPSQAMVVTEWKFINLKWKTKETEDLCLPSLGIRMNKDLALSWTCKVLSGYTFYLSYCYVYETTGAICRYRNGGNTTFYILYLISTVDTNIVMYYTEYVPTCLLE